MDTFNRLARSLCHKNAILPHAKTTSLEKAILFDDSAFYFFFEYLILYISNSLVSLNVFVEHFAMVYLLCSVVLFFRVYFPHSWTPSYRYLMVTERPVAC